MDFDLKELNRFIVKAHFNGYASSGEGGEKTLSDGCKELKYRESNFYMRDRYFGSKTFIGEEVIFYRQNPVWGMNYYGAVIAEPVSTKEIYSFLKDALKRVTENLPYRGPSNFKNGDFEYWNNADGQIENFSGQERIFHKKELVYTLNYHGGLINK